MIAENRIATLETQVAEVEQERDEAIISRDANAQTIDRITKEHGREVEILCSCGDEAQRERDTLRAALKQCAEALEVMHDCGTLRDDGKCDGCIVSKALADPVVQAVLGQKGGDADGKEATR